MGNLTQNFQTSNTDSGVAESEIEAYRFVKAGTAVGSIVPATAETDIVLGVSLAHADANQQCTYQTRGVAMVEASASIDKGAQVEPTTGGKAATAAGASARSAGVTAQAAGDDAEVIPVIINLPNLNGPANS